MSKQSEKVKRWRKNTKRRIVKAMGGKCVVCDYDKSDAVLSLHHLDPSKKEITLAGIRANPRSWIRIVEELRKCILVCSNCHGEIHEGITSVPNNATTFNESYLDYNLDCSLHTATIVKPTNAWGIRQ